MTVFMCICATQPHVVTFKSMGDCPIHRFVSAYQRHQLHPLPWMINSSHLRGHIFVLSILSVKMRTYQCQ